MDTLITIVIFIAIAIVSSWLKKKQAPDESWPDQPAPPLPGQPQRPAPPRPKPASWEEELRKLLEGDEPAQPPPPPVVVYEKPKPVRPPPVAPRPVVPPRPAPVLVKDDEGVGLPVRLPSLTQSSQAYQRASQLDLKVAERLRQIGQQVTLHTAVQTTEVVSREILLAKSMLRNRDTLRSAIVASVILSSPKAFEA